MRYLATSENWPMPGNISGPEAHAFNHREAIYTWPNVDNSGDGEGSNIMVWGPWQEGLLNPPYSEVMMCNLFG